jgi:ATP-dependent Clp protease adaptor protein ClpS
MKTMMSSTETLQEYDVAFEEMLGLNNSEIVVYNDDVNTFDHVIETLIDVCEHHPHQAEQCAMIIHHNGKCTVKTGSLDELKPKCSKLLSAGLSAEII